RVPVDVRAFENAVQRRDRQGFERDDRALAHELSRAGVAGKIRAIGRLLEQLEQHRFHEVTVQGRTDAATWTLAFDANRHAPEFSPIVFLVENLEPDQLRAAPWIE